MVVVPIILSMQEILNNEGESQIMDTLGNRTWTRQSVRWKIPWMLRCTARERQTVASNWTGLATAVPVLPNTGVYGGIDSRRQCDLAHQDL
jgi:hypothetical protein